VQEISGIEGDLEARRDKLAETSGEISVLRSKLDEMTELKMGLEKLKRDHDTECKKVSLMPEKARRQVELVQNMLAQLEKQRAEQTARLEATEAAVQAAQEVVRTQPPPCAADACQAARSAPSCAGTRRSAAWRTRRNC